MDVQTFWDRLDKSGECWEWTGYRLPKGYGRLYVNGVHVYAHRLAYGLAVGPVPDGMYVCHRCDNPPCANPAHLFAGSPLVNVHDKIAKGRAVNRFELRDREPFGPLVLRSQRGLIHRAKPGPRVHPRCAAGKPIRGVVLTAEEAIEYATGRPGVLCRYPWCFREVVKAAGIDPEVGHVARDIPRPRSGRPVPLARHRAEVARAHERVSDWAWCACGWIIVRSTDVHNPARSWWVHKGRPREAA